MRRRSLHAIVAACWLAGLTHVSAAGAFCRARTCDPRAESCSVDARGCETSGVALVWRREGITFSVDPAGSPLLGISARDTEGALGSALDAWQHATCNEGQHPSIALSLVEASAERLSEADVIVTYLDDAWPYNASIGALTTLSLDLDSGEILGALLEINSALHSFSLDASPPEIDLEAVLTHEVGHVIGLDHSLVEGATMRPETAGFGSQELRTLAQDDVNAVCAVYAKKEAEPKDPLPVKNRAQSSSSCTMSRSHYPTSTSLGVLTLFVLVLGARRWARLEPLV